MHMGHLISCFRRSLNAYIEIKFHMEHPLAMMTLCKLTTLYM